MRSRVQFRLLLACLCVGVAIASSRAADVPAPADAAPALAWRLDAISGSLLGPAQPPAAWRRSAALLEAASRLNPAEPRFPRLRALAAMHVGDADAAIAAVRAYRALRPADRAAQAQLIDLYAGKFETVDAKLVYLKSLLDKEEVPVEVRANVASTCAALLLQTSRADAAAMARRAVELYPLPRATRQYYDLVAREQPPTERARALLAVIQSNPNDPAYLAELGNLLAANGMPEESIQAYGTALTVVMRSGPSRPPEFHDLLINFAAQQIIAGHGASADTFLGRMLDELPLDPDAWFLKLTIAKASAGEVTFGQTLELARNALAQRWNAVREEILNGPPAPAATQPASSPAPAAPPAPAATAPAKVEPLDPAPVIAKLKGADNANATDAAVGALVDLAWFELYHANQPDAARKWIDALAGGLLPADSPVLLRLVGWHALQSGQVPQAREAFTKIAGGDALASLGLVRADQAEKKAPDVEAVRSLLAAHRTGLVGAIVWDALRDLKITPATQPAVAGIAEDLKKFPGSWLSLFDARDVRRVYDLRAEPVESNVPPGDPMLFRVTVQNTSKNDVTIGPDSLLRPDLWVDGQIMGLNRQMFRGVAYEQLGGELVLRPGASATQVVRVDVGEMRKALANTPATSTRVTGAVVTNPLVMASGVVPGPGGVSVNFLRTAVQVGLPIGNPNGKKQLDAALASKSPLDRLHAADVMAAYVRLAERQGNADESLKKLAADLPSRIDKLRADASPAVAAWAGYLVAAASPAARQEAVAAEMAKSADWSARLLSLFVEGPNQRQIATALANDADATVKAAALATTELLESPATQPAAAASQPTSAPASPAGGAPGQ